jgi:hypothetical protein
MNSPIFAQVNEQPREVVLPQKRIGVLIVAYNAVTTLTKVLRRIPQKVWEMVEEVAVFDDASKDDTFEQGDCWSRKTYHH